MPEEITTLLTFFGGTGDLAKRKLYTSVYNLYKKGFLQEHFAVVGAARQDLTNDEFRQMVRESIASFVEDQDNAEAFISHFYYVNQDITDPASYKPMLELNNELDAKYNLKGNRIFYMSVAPRFFGTIAKYLKSEGLLTENGKFNRLMIEKPFGVSYDTAEELQAELEAAFDDDQIYRIDHYLGKEMVQNIAPIRFGNNLIDNAWNKDYIDNIQVTLSEVLGVEERAGYYDTSGALRDMIQNHTMQIIGWLAMEKPENFTDKEIRAAKNAAFDSLKIYSAEEVAENFVRGQYGESADGSQRRYLDEPDVPADSQNNTYVAGKLQFDMDRWEGVPFFIRSGKRLAAKQTRVDVVFKKDANIFGMAGDNLVNPVLSILIDPVGKVEFTMNAKKVSENFELRPVKLEWQVSAEDKAITPEPYERMIHDAMDGNGSNFADWNGVAVAWKFVDAVQNAWDNSRADFPNYVSGSMGPAEADELLAKDNASWIFEG